METSKTTAVAPEAKAVETKATKPQVVSQKYIIKLNTARATNYKIPKSIEKKEGKISSEFKMHQGNVTKAIIKGLTPEQERYFSAELINKTPKDQGFEQDMMLFWADFTIDVPEKLVLDASYTVKTVMLDGMHQEIEVPVNLYEYMKANFAKASARVAFTNDEKSNSDLYEFVMQDLSIEERNKQDAFKLKQEADKAKVTLFGSISEADYAKVDWLLDVLKEPTEVFYTLTLQDKLIKLDEIVSKKPIEFLNAYNNKSLEAEALLYRLIQLAVVTKEGEAIFYGDMALGSTQKEAILFLQDPAKSGFVVKMKAQLTEILKR
jgi:hypothetical protein